MEQNKTGLPAEASAKAGPRDIFLHLLSIISLYVAVGSFISLVFSYINVGIPDPLDHASGIYDSIRWSIAILIIVFPVYGWSVWFLNRGYKASPEKREMKSRRWLIYLTLFLAALIIIGDLVTLVYYLLRGEFTSRFLLKVLTVFLVSGAVFVYYLWEVRRAIGSAKPWYIQGVTYLSIVAVAAVIVSGFFIVGSPAEERAYRLDYQRTFDLGMIQNQIVSFWQAKQKLPNNLPELEDDITGFRAPKDSETGLDYKYRKTGNLSFELCANFARPSRRETTSSRPLSSEPHFDGNWEHQAGEKCFTRTIDPERYPPLNPPVKGRSGAF